MTRGVARRGRGVSRAGAGRGKKVAGKPVAVKSDEHWKAIVLGRQWGDKTYPGFSGGNNLQYLNFLC